jgi:hypothetical protein
MQKTTKKFIWIVSSIAVCGILAAAAVIVFAAAWNNNRRMASDYLLANKPALEQVVARLSAAGKDTYTDYDGHTVNYWHNTGRTEFNMYMIGMGPSTYGGFYYSPDDKPLGFQGAPAAFTEQADGTFVYNHGGGNVEYTGRITENWFWFEARF